MARFTRRQVEGSSHVRVNDPIRGERQGQVLGVFKDYGFTGKKVNYMVKFIRLDNGAIDFAWLSEIEELRE